MGKRKKKNHGIDPLLLSPSTTPKVGRQVTSKRGCGLSTYSIVFLCERYTAAGRVTYEIQCPMRCTPQQNTEYTERWCIHVECRIWSLRAFRSQSTRHNSIIICLSIGYINPIISWLSIACAFHFHIHHISWGICGVISAHWSLCRIPRSVERPPSIYARFHGIEGKIDAIGPHN